MANSRAFAYNPTLVSIAGATNYGYLCVGYPSVSYASTGLTWWGGPSEGKGYVIAAALPGSTQPTPDPNRPFAAVQFWGTEVLVGPTSTNAFLTLANSIGSTTFPTVTNATDWLTANGYWTSYLPYVAGLYKTTYSGYFADNVSFFATATPTTFGTNPATSVQTTAISELNSGDGDYFSCQWLGYFKPTTTETYTFFTSSDDASYVWVGSNAQTGFTTTNSTVNNGGAHGPTERSGSIALTAGVYYPIRIQFGEQSGGDVMTFNYSTPTITKTTTVTGLVFYNPSTNNF